MSYYPVPAYDIEAYARDIGTVVIERGGDVFVVWTIGLPDINAPVVSGSIVDTIYMDIRTVKTATTYTYRTDSGMGGHLSSTRPDPNTLVVTWHLPDTASRDLELGQNTSSINGTSQRAGFPSAGFSDLLVELSDTYRHYVAAFKIESRVMTTRDWSS